MSTGINAINEAVKNASAFTHPLFNELGKVIVGQHYLTERLVIGLLANSHVLLEGVPGLAKTLAVKSLAACMHVKFSRLQFTPDMLPADVIGTQIYNPQSGGFSTRKGRSEEHTSELQSQSNLVCRLLLEKKKETDRQRPHTATVP